MLRALATVAAPSSTFLAGGAPARGFPSHATAAPQAAMPQPGSAWPAASKLLTAGENQNEWRRATPRKNSGWAAAVHEVGTFTVPSFPASWAATGDVARMQATRAIGVMRIVDPP